MAAKTASGLARRWQALRWWAWGGAAVLLALPLVAMRFTEEVYWTGLDFLVMGVMLAAACGAFELVLRVARSGAYAVAGCIAIAIGFLTTWIALAVGIIGEPGNRANLAFFGVVALALVGAALARLRPRGMARAMATAAVAQGIAGGVALAAHSPAGACLSAVFAALWLVAALLFGAAARKAPLATASS